MFAPYPSRPQYLVHHAEKLFLNPSLVLPIYNILQFLPVSLFISLFEWFFKQFCNHDRNDSWASWSAIDW